MSFSDRYRVKVASGAARKNNNAPRNERKRDEIEREREGEVEMDGRREKRWKQKGNATERFTLPVAPYIVPYLSGFGDPIGKAL